MSRSGSAENRVNHVKVESSCQLEEDYVMGERIGEGTFGTVIRATCLLDNSFWAIKKINKERGTGSSSKSWEHEVHILRLVRHCNIVNVKEIVESDHHVYLIMELCEGGNLADELARRVRFSGSQARSVMDQLTSAVDYLHKKSIVHRDLKLENLLLLSRPSDSLEAPLTIKLIDFGLSVELRKCEDVMLEFCGTPLYIAPEIIAGKSYTRQCDVWSMGVVMHLLIVGKPPFLARTEEELFDEINEPKVLLKAAERVRRLAGVEASAAFSRLLHPDPAHRLSSGEFRSEPWVTGEPRGADNQSTTNVLELMRQFHRGNESDGSLISDPSAAAAPTVKKKAVVPRANGTTKSNIGKVGSKIQPQNKKVSTTNNLSH